jgi:hypothetical protein
MEKESTDFAFNPAAKHELKKIGKDKLAVMAVYPMAAAMRANNIVTGYPVGTWRSCTHYACTKI